MRLEKIYIITFNLRFRSVVSCLVSTYRSFSAYDPRVVGDVLILSLFDEGGDDDNDGDEEEHDDESDDPTGSS